MIPEPIQFFHSMLQIRAFEETVLDEFRRGIFSGTTHTSLGQEANAVGVIQSLDENDVIVTNHRCHGHFIAYGGDMRALFAELMGKATGVCGGRGGSQHIHWRNLYSNGVQGGIVPIAAGMALAEKRLKSGSVVAVFIGDGTMGEGAIYEAFNMASMWSLPLLVVVENNHIAQTTPTVLTIAGNIADRFKAFAIPSVEMDTSDVLEISGAARSSIEAVRNSCSPRALILNTVRFGPHSKGDDTRSKDEVQLLREKRDPIRILRARLNPAEAELTESEVRDEIKDAFQKALADPAAGFEEVSQ